MTHLMNARYSQRRPSARRARLARVFARVVGPVLLATVLGYFALGFLAAVGVMA